MSSDALAPGLPGWARALVTCVLLGAFAALLAVGLRPRTLPVLGSLPEATLTGQDGTPFALSSLRGKIWVANFIFTHCRETCPRMTARMLVLQDRLQREPRLVGQVRLVSFSVDPERDTPKALEEYGKSYGADASLWTFLTADAVLVGRLCQEGFRLPLGGSSGGHDAGAPPALVHSDRFVLVDGEGQVRGYYSPIGAEAEEEARRLVADLYALLP